MLKSKVLLAVLAMLMVPFLAIGFAEMTDSLLLTGNASIDGPAYPVYITDISPENSGGFLVTNFFGTTMSAQVSSSSTGRFTITVVNVSDKTYVFERVIEGKETAIPGIYQGSDITYTLSGLEPLQEISPNGGTITFNLTLSNPKGVKTDQFYLLFNFIEKTGTEILPGNPDEPDVPDPTDPTDPSTPTDPSAPTEPDTPDTPHSDFFGLVEALLSTSNNCLNHNDLIFDAVMESLTSKKRPKEDPPILHCQVNSVSGGTMSAIAEFANTHLTDDLHFIFEAEADPNHQNTRLILYMYYEHTIDSVPDGAEILVYKQIITRGSDGIWFADGSYTGRATVGDYFGGGSSGKDVRTINAYSWKAGAPTT